MIELVKIDVGRGLVTAEGARRYGVVIEEGTVNAEATNALREQLVADR